MKKIRTLLKNIGTGVLLLIIGLEMTFIFSYYANQDLPSNILGIAPYLIAEDDKIIGIKQGDLLLARIPNGMIQTEEIISYIDGNRMQIGKIMQKSARWYLVKNDYGTCFITESQIIGQKIRTVPYIGSILLWFTSVEGRGIIFVLALMIVTYPKWYYRMKYSLIYTKQILIREKSRRSEWNE